PPASHSRFSASCTLHLPHLPPFPTRRSSDLTDGSPDPGRPVVYVGEAQLLTQAGLLPLVFEIDGTSLADAIEKFAAGATAAIERTRRELEELRREAASQIVVPPTLPPGFDPKGGLPGGGKIHLR